MIGVTGKFSAVDGLTTSEENLLLMADLHHLSTSEGSDRGRTPGALRPGGGREEARLDLATTRVGSPRIIVLDEPTTGLDLRSRHTVRAVTRGLVSDGVAVFLATRFLEEADELVDPVAVLNDDEIAAERRSPECGELRNFQSSGCELGAVVGRVLPYPRDSVERAGRAEGNRAGQGAGEAAQGASGAAICQLDAWRASSAV